MIRRIAVIGDVMLDKYDYCRNRENPESSAPCYTTERTEYKPGGAGNVAANLVSLGSFAELISVVGVDPEAAVLTEVLDRFSVPYRFIRDKTRQTIVKERTVSISDKRYHFRKDRESREEINDNHVLDIICKIKGFDTIIVSDYDKGVVSERLMQRLKGLGIPIIVDPKPVHKKFYRNAFLITPNIKEAREMSGLEDELLAAEKLAKELNTRVLLTRSERGISYFGLAAERDRRIDFAAEAKEVYDVTGAGDTVTATFTHFLNKGCSIRRAVRLANKAAGIAVGHLGCYQVSEKEILDEK